jgi:hypothetical protein
MKRIASVIAQVGLFGGFGVCNYLVAMQLAAARDAREAPACVGPTSARRHVVYLHGLDSHAPSWQELDNRRALVAIPDTVFAIPRAPVCGSGRCWADGDDGTPATVAAIRDAAHACFGARPLDGVIGFSRGGFALARIDRCDTVGARWAIIAGAFGYGDELRLRDCTVGVVIGERDRYHRTGAIDYAHRRQAAQLPTVLVEHDGGHRLDTRSLTSAVDQLQQATGTR